MSEINLDKNFDPDFDPNAVVDENAPLVLADSEEVMTSDTVRALDFPAEELPNEHDYTVELMNTTTQEITKHVVTVPVTQRAEEAAEEVRDKQNDEDDYLVVGISRASS